jgi:hypothetical protein
MARFAAPEGWRVLRTRSRLEAHWSSPDGRWARYSIRLEPRDAPPAGEVFFQRDVGTAQLIVTFTSSDLSAETIEAASALLTPVQHLLARAGA